MGVSAKSLFRIQELNKLGLLKLNSNIIELGAQELYCKGMEQSVADFINNFVPGSNVKSDDNFIKKIAHRGFTSELFKYCGFSYKALDIFDGDEVLLFDLNIESPGPELIEKFDLVTNFGTTEHIINQYKSFKTIHELTRPGGLIYHDLPLGGYHTHGYFNYNPLFFQHLAEANQYQVIFQWYSVSNTSTSAPLFMQSNGFGGHWSDMGIEFIFKKMSNKPFQMPLETGTSLALNAEVWKGADPYGKRINTTVLNAGNYKGQLGSLAEIENSEVSFLLKKISGWDLQREVINRYKMQLRRIFGLSC
jgi:hypothetical protein